MMRILLFLATNAAVLVLISIVFRVLGIDGILAAAGVDNATPDPDGSTIVRDANGNATGLLRETAQRLLNDAVDEFESPQTPEEIDQVMRERVFLAGREALEPHVEGAHEHDEDG